MFKNLKDASVGEIIAELQARGCVTVVLSQKDAAFMLRQADPDQYYSDEDELACLRAVDTAAAVSDLEDRLGQAADQLAAERQCEHGTHREAMCA